MSLRLLLLAAVALIPLVVELAQVLFNPRPELVEVVLVALLVFVLHVLLEDQLHLLWLLLDCLVAEAPFEQMSSLCHILLSVLHLHVHVDRPDIHPLRVV